MKTNNTQKGALINNNTIKNMLRYKTETRPVSVALYDIRPGNGAGPFLQPGARTGHTEAGLLLVHGSSLGQMSLLRHQWLLIGTSWSWTQARWAQIQRLSHWATRLLLKGGEPSCNEPRKHLCVVTTEPALQRKRRSKSSHPVSQGLSTVTGDTNGVLNVWVIWKIPKPALKLSNLRIFFIRIWYNLGKGTGNVDLYSAYAWNIS